MLNGLKLIGLCVTKIHDETRSEYTQRLFEYAEKKGYKVIVYNSFVDFYNMTSYLSGSSSVYDSISFSMLDAIVIMSETIYDQSIKDRIIKKAKLKQREEELYRKEQAKKAEEQAKKEYRIKCFKSTKTHLNNFFMYDRRENCAFWIGMLNPINTTATIIFLPLYALLSPFSGLH